MTCEVSGEVITSQHDVVIGCDGLRSTVRRSVLGETEAYGGAYSAFIGTAPAPDIFSGLIILNDPGTGFPKAVMDCTWITAKRTGAATALAAVLTTR